MSELHVVPFKVGDLVRLRNPWGPVMTVRFVSDALVHCCWFDARSRYQDEPFVREVLEMAPACDAYGTERLHRLIGEEKAAAAYQRQPEVKAAAPA